MKVIGITGGVGAGKSTVLNILEQEYGAYILEADRTAHRLMEPGQPVYESIRKAFPGDILDTDGRICRERLGTLVFHDPEALSRLNGIVHPAVKDDILRAIEACRRQTTVPYFVIEAALLIEDGYAAVCDELWYVYAPEELRRERLMKNRGYTAKKCESIMKNQGSDSFYRRYCSHIIENGATLSDAKKQIEELLKNP